MYSLICSPLTVLVVLSQAHTHTHKDRHTQSVKWKLASAALALPDMWHKTQHAKKTTLGICRMWITFKAKKRMGQTTEQPLPNISHTHFQACVNLLGRNIHT